MLKTLVTAPAGSCTAAGIEVPGHGHRSTWPLAPMLKVGRLKALVLPPAPSLPVRHWCATAGHHLVISPNTG
ncbi:hypothetical protein [uncultured Thiodictyon sp.]|uniref:hypothetical protein n=1 Tax=uncultured Thiodictyon sp. TaxID=1846217 RepID=UPI0025F3CFB7|nr:hypothetical protein [uncultured Thiodictyon sp.]